MVSIKITIYRLARQAKLVDYLCAAAEHGKDVTVLIELRARFDEQHNIDWSERLEDAGCTILYGFEEYKVHSKICLITPPGARRSAIHHPGGHRQLQRENGEAVYRFVPVDGRPAQSAPTLRNFSQKHGPFGNLEGTYRHLLVAPSSLKSAVLQHMDAEIAKREKGRIRIKINSITDVDIIEKLMQASCAGVQIDMIVRGICCILPGVPGKTENLRIRSIVGRYLEHSRIYCFGDGASESIYISSADFMTRNTQRRVEIACPVYDPAARAKLHAILDACLTDNVKARALQCDGSYRPFDRRAPAMDSQQFLMDEALAHQAQEAEAEPAGAESGRFPARSEGLFPKITAQGSGPPGSAPLLFAFSLLPRRFLPLHPANRFFGHAHAEGALEGQGRGVVRRHLAEGQPAQGQDPQNGAQRSKYAPSPCRRYSGSTVSMPMEPS